MNSGSMPELLQEVAGRLVSVEEGLAALDNHKTALHNHADMVKGEINNAVERQMLVLKAREKQLIRQVEVASTHMNSEVNVTQAQLLQHKGALSVTRTILDNCNSSALEEGLCEGDNYNFSGRGGRCCDTNGNPPPAFPRGGAAAAERSCCRYSGGDGRTSRASAAGGCGSTLSSTIATTVNSLPHQDVAGLLQHTEKLLRVPLVSVSMDEPSLSSTLKRWGRVSLPPSLSHSELLPRHVEEYGDAEHHVLHKSLAPGTAQAPIDVRRPYLLAARARHGLMAAQAEAHEDLLPREPTKPLPVPAPTRGKEDLVRWLHHLQLDEEDRYDDRPCRYIDDSLSQDEMNVEDACQANETCSSFSNCVMGRKCQKAALEKAEQAAKWRQQQQQSEEFNRSQVCVFKMDLTVNSRKRHLSDSGCEAAKAVVSHMTSIRSSANDAWLMPVKTEVLSDAVNNFYLDDLSEKTFLSDSISGRPCSSMSDFMDANKKLKVDHFADTPALAAMPCDSVRSSILYQAPQVQWRLASFTCKPATVDKKVSAMECCSDSPLPVVATITAARVPLFGQNLDSMECKTSSSDFAAKAWLLPAVNKEGQVPQMVTKKASNDKENNLCRASLIKTLSDVGSIENLKDRVDCLTGEADNKVVSDLELKESWLLKKYSSMKSDNKIEEVTQKKSEWLSSSSLASFSVISDPDGLINSWLLMPSRVLQY